MAEVSYEEFAWKCEQNGNIPNRLFHKEYFGENFTFDHESQVNRLTSSPDVAVVEIYGHIKKQKSGYCAAYGVFCGPESLNNRSGRVPMEYDLDKHQLSDRPAVMEIVAALVAIDLFLSPNIPAAGIMIAPVEKIIKITRIVMKTRNSLVATMMMQSIWHWIRYKDKEKVLVASKESLINNLFLTLHQKIRDIEKLGIAISFWYVRQENGLLLWDAQILCNEFPDEQEPAAIVKKTNEGNAEHLTIEEDAYMSGGVIFCEDDDSRDETINMADDFTIHPRTDDPVKLGKRARDLDSTTEYHRRPTKKARRAGMIDDARVCKMTRDPIQVSKVAFETDGVSKGAGKIANSGPKIAVMESPGVWKMVADVGELEVINRVNIIDGGRTRGKTINFTKVAEKIPEDERAEDEDDDFESPKEKETQQLNDGTSTKVTKKGQKAKTNSKALDMDSMILAKEGEGVWKLSKAEHLEPRSIGGQPAKEPKRHVQWM